MLEVLVVTGIIAVLAGLLLPALLAARREAARVQCLGNLRSLGQALYAYASNNDGYLYPLGAFDPKSGKHRLRWGLPVPPHERWPAIVFKLSDAVNPLPYNPAAYTDWPYDPETFPAEPFTPAILRCPLDDAAYEAHTYVLNGHLGRRGFRLGSRDVNGRTPAEIILAGEKYSRERDYYLQEKDFDRLIDVRRHGALRGSNLLFLDGHAETHPPESRKSGDVDPWSLDPPLGPR